MRVRCEAKLRNVQEKERLRQLLQFHIKILAYSWQIIIFPFFLFCVEGFVEVRREKVSVFFHAFQHNLFSLSGSKGRERDDVCYFFKNRCECPQQQHLKETRKILQRKFNFPSWRGKPLAMKPRKIAFVQWLIANVVIDNSFQLISFSVPTFFCFQFI